MNLALPLFEPDAAARAVNAAHPYSVVSLFSGAMGLDLGLNKAGLRVVVSQDIDRWCVETMRRNGHTAIEGDVRELVSADPACEFLLRAGGLTRESVFAVVGGPPCQPFSVAGKRKGVEDARGQLFEEFIKVVAALHPRFFIMENVKGLASMPSDSLDKQSAPVLQTILSAFKSIGYHTVHGVLDAVHYGTPQFRERLVIVGSREAENIFLPAPTHFHQHQNPSLRWKTLGEAIADIKEPGAHTNFSLAVKRYLALIPAGGNWKNLPPDLAREAMGGAYESGGGKVGFYRRLSLSEPSPTLVTSPIQKATMLCHPAELRPLSVLEYARLQQFPDNWKFEGKTGDCYRQIGNAVPVTLG
ncbi:MAG: DNA cytosine methyltransferase, partial [Rhodoferax sp.]|nr:DNA cytosine methyltransferase [Rhodoferax sp.]